MVSSYSNVAYFNESSRTYPNVVVDWKVDLLKKYYQGGRVLEVGCGTGNYLGVLPGSVGIDSSPVAVQIAKERGFSAELMGFPDTCFEDEVFGLVFSYSTLYYIRSYGGVISEFSRLLKKGGIGVLEFGNRRSLNHFWDMRWGVRQYHVFEEEIRVLLDLYDFEVLEFKRFQLHPWSNKETKSRFGFRLVWVVKKK